MLVTAPDFFSGQSGAIEHVQALLCDCAQTVAFSRFYGLLYGLTRADSVWPVHAGLGCCINRVAEAKGKVKEIAGKAFSKDLENKGKVQNALGKVQAAYGDLKEDVKKAVKSE